MPPSGLGGCTIPGTFFPTSLRGHFADSGTSQLYDTATQEVFSRPVSQTWDALGLGGCARQARPFPTSLRTRFADSRDAPVKAWTKDLTLQSTGNSACQGEIRIARQGEI